MGQGIATEFAGVNFGDQRLNKRLVRVAEALSQNPEESICSAIGSFHDAKGAHKSWKGWKALYERIEFLEEMNCG